MSGPAAQGLLQASKITPAQTKKDDLDAAWRSQYIDGGASWKPSTTTTAQAAGANSKSPPSGTAAHLLLDRYLHAQDTAFSQGKEGKESRTTSINLSQWISNRKVSIMPKRGCYKDAEWYWLYLKSYVVQRDLITGYMPKKIINTRRKPLISVVKKKGIAPPVPAAVPAEGCGSTPEALLLDMMNYKKELTDHYRTEWEAPTKQMETDPMIVNMVRAAEYSLKGRGEEGETNPREPRPSSGNKNKKASTYNSACPPYASKVSPAFYTQAQEVLTVATQLEETTKEALTAGRAGGGAVPSTNPVLQSYYAYLGLSDAGGGPSSRKGAHRRGSGVYASAGGSIADAAIEAAIKGPGADALKHMVQELEETEYVHPELREDLDGEEKRHRMACYGERVRVGLTTGYTPSHKHKMHTRLEMSLAEKAKLQRLDSEKWDHLKLRPTQIRELKREEAKNPQRGKQGQGAGGTTQSFTGRMDDPPAMASAGGGSTPTRRNSPPPTRSSTSPKQQVQRPGNHNAKLLQGPPRVTSLVEPPEAGQKTMTYTRMVACGLAGPGAASSPSPAKAQAGAWRVRSPTSMSTAQLSQPGRSSSAFGTTRSMKSDSPSFNNSSSSSFQGATADWSFCGLQSIAQLAQSEPRGSAPKFNGGGGAGGRKMSVASSQVSEDLTTKKTTTTTAHVNSSSATSSPTAAAKKSVTPFGGGPAPRDENAPGVPSGIGTCYSHNGGKPCHLAGAKYHLKPNVLSAVEPSAGFKKVEAKGKAYAVTEEKGFTSPWDTFFDDTDTTSADAIAYGQKLLAEQDHSVDEYRSLLKEFEKTTKYGTVGHVKLNSNKLTCGSVTATSGTGDPKKDAKQSSAPRSSSSSGAGASQLELLPLVLAARFSPEFREAHCSASAKTSALAGFTRKGTKTGGINSGVFAHLVAGHLAAKAKSAQKKGEAGAAGSGASLNAVTAAFAPQNLTRLLQPYLGFLSVLDLSENRLAGLPPDFGNWFPQLRGLYLHGNRLSTFKTLFQVVLLPTELISIPLPGAATPQGMIIGKRGNQERMNKAEAQRQKVMRQRDWCKGKRAEVSFYPPEKKLLGPNTARLRATLQTLTLHGNPLESHAERSWYRSNVLMAFPFLVSLDNTQVLPEVDLGEVFSGEQVQQIEFARASLPELLCGTSHQTQNQAKTTFD